MSHADRDALDARLIAAGDLAPLFAAYQPVLRDRLRAMRVPADRADEVLQETLLRLLRELRSGMRYPVPFRVVAHQVLGWTLRGDQRQPTLPLGDWDAAADDPALDEALHRYDLELRLRGFPPRVGQVMRLRFGEGMEIDDIAMHLGMERNAVDQALHRGIRRMREVTA